MTMIEVEKAGDDFPKDFKKSCLNYVNKDNQYRKEHPSLFTEHYLAQNNHEYVESKLKFLTPIRYKQQKGKTSRVGVN
jgi:hypothetical protein